MSSSSNAPVKKECNIPGKQAYMLWRTLFEIDEKYAPIKAIGKGAYGVVCSAKDTASGEKVAIKKITNAFENLTDARRTLREMMLLRHLKHDNIIAVRDLMRPQSREKFNDVYLVYELMDTDLHQIIRSSQALTDDHYQYFIYQVCSSHSRGTSTWQGASTGCFWSGRSITCVHGKPMVHPQLRVTLTCSMLPDTLACCHRSCAA